MPFDNVILIESVFLGKTYYDEIPYILYRQHGENVSGQKEFGIKKIVARFNQLPTLNDSNSIFHDLSEFILKNFFDN